MERELKRVVRRLTTASANFGSFQSRMEQAIGRRWLSISSGRHCRLVGNVGEGWTIDLVERVQMMVDGWTGCDDEGGRVQ